MIQTKPSSLEMILTGRSAPEELIKLADYVTEMKMIKHPFNKGVYARKGIEY
jgi:cob(I)alamin adenosyltransferase